MAHVLAQLVGRHLDLREEALRDADQRFPRPRVEPVDDRAVGDRRELAAARAEGVADRRHAHDHVQVGAHLVDEVVPAIVARVHQASRLHLGPDRVDDVVLVVVVVELGDVARREQVVEVDEHLLVDNLLVGEQEDDLVALEARRRVERVHVLLEVAHAVRLGQLHLEDGEGRDERREPRERLLARAAHADEERVAARRVDDARDAADVLHRLVEEHEVHLGVGFIIFVQLGVENFLELLRVGD
mmetsp:Transcript_44777/g.132226  ORF Transcript_44777/g.132226 Transcript_44777/m.132226 type:complete len:244 (-) Transcript_44777:532-1263(-)